MRMHMHTLDLRRDSQVPSLRQAWAAGLIALGLLSMPTQPAHAQQQDIPGIPTANGQAEFNLAATTLACMSCHGTNGRAEGVGYVLSGRPASVLNKALIDFKEGRRDGSVMPGIARSFANPELEALAKEFSKFK
jgi:cytochrome subunit of sulfide dehydrogenase